MADHKTAQKFQPETKIEIAKGYAKRNWKVLILRPDTKKPYNRWRKGALKYDPTLDLFDAPDLLAHRATNDPRLIEAWLTTHPDAGLAIDCRESGLFAIDIDHKPDEGNGKLGFAALAALRRRFGPNHGESLPDASDGSEYGALLEELQRADSEWGSPLLSRSPSGGLHLIYSAPAGDSFAATDFASQHLGFKGLDIKWNGYIAVPDGGERRKWLNETVPGPMPSWLGDAIADLRFERKTSPPKEADVSEATSANGLVMEGARNSTLAKVAGSLRRAGLEESEIYENLFDVNLERCSPPLPDDEVGKIAESVARYEVGAFACTDLGNALRFVGEHRDDLLHCEALGNNVWFEWDGTVWKKSLGSVAKRRAVETVHRLSTEVHFCSDASRQRELRKWAKQSQSAQRLNAMTGIAGAWMEFTPDMLDADWSLLTAPNGTLELREDGSVNLRGHRREDRVTLKTAVEYVPGIRCAVWEDILERVLPDPELRGFLKRAFGYTLYGGQAEKAIFFAYGPPDGGKSTVLGAFEDALGDYGTTTRLSTFGSGAEARENTPALALLHGSRFVHIPEVPPVSQFGTGLLKAWAGGDRVQACQKHERPFQFRPPGKLWFVGNHQPSIPYDDAGAWRRFNVIPFVNPIPRGEQVEGISARIDRRAVLAWAVDGYREWREAGGLNPPNAVHDAVVEYREAQDPILEFVETRLTLNPMAWTSIADLYRAYTGHCDALRVPILQRLTKPKLIDNLVARPGVTRGQARNRERARGLYGVELRDEFDFLD
jgi:putative DNA primase/helicase